MTNLLNQHVQTKRTRTEFTQDYKMKIFMLWYNKGKPVSERLYSIIITENIREPLSGEIPTRTTIDKWIKKDFELKATFLDLEASKAIEKELVANKIQMLQSHSKIGQELYEMGMVHLRTEGLGNSRNALSAVIEGLRIEKESSGVNIKFAELDKLNDEELLAELNKLVVGSEIISIEPND
jgi:hypothetical protein